MSNLATKSWKKRALELLLMGALGGWPAGATVSSIQLQAPGSSGELTLRGGDVRRQLLVSAQHADGTAEDFTRKAVIEVTPREIAHVREGLLVPKGNGQATIIATVGDQRAELKMRVSDIESEAPIHFGNQVVPIFTKNGCNGGGCHGKSGGQNGFKLSLLGFEPTEDYEYLVKEARGRRLFPAAPERSLLLLKGAAVLPHGGGKKLEIDSDDYNLLMRWIGQGMPYGNPNEPTVERVEVFPKERTMKLGGEQQLAVLAHYTDGRIEDVTRGALYEPNEKSMAKVDEKGRVTVFEQPGDVAVMIRYQSKVAVFRAALPLGAPIETFPPGRNFVDELVYAKLRKLGLPPSGICDDATFLRRSTIDIAGRLPTVEESQRFLASEDQAKREKWVDELLQSPDYATYFANKWSSLLRNKRADALHARGTFAFYNWIRDSFHENKPYDQFVREIVAASGDIGENPPVAWYRQVRDQKNQLEDAAQLFLGQRLQCAQCHHHPFEKWSQDDYYSLAAVFSRVGRKSGARPGEEIIVHQRGAASTQNKKTGKALKPAALGTSFASLSMEEDPRAAFADWMSSANNPFFAKSLVNRYWKHFFNRGLVDPEDDMRETNPPTNPELLEALAKDFVESGYDLKRLVRTICTSTIYQLSALPNEHNRVDRQHYSRYYPKRLTAEVLYDAVHGVLQARSQFDGLPAGMRAVELPDNSFNASSYFLTVFGRPDAASSCECERSQDASLAQSLHLLNSKEIQDKLSSDQGRAAGLAKDSRTDVDKIAEIYLAAFARRPAAEELEKAAAYVAKKTANADAAKLSTEAARRQAYEDLLWATINTKEFLFNH